MPDWNPLGTYRTSPLPLTPPPPTQIPHLDMPPLTLSQEKDLVTRLYPEKWVQQQKKPAQKVLRFAFGRSFS
jgi:hypothetical protein